MRLSEFKKPSIMLSLVLSLMITSFVINPITTPAANAKDSHLRPGCKKSAYGAQRCKVYSAAMKKNISVIIRPSLTRNNPRVVQFLDGLTISNDTNSWAFHGQALRRLKKINATLVFPAGDDRTMYQNWSRRTSDGRLFRYETFYTRELPNYLAKQFGVPNGGRGKTGITGLSAGAFGALSLASMHPKLYSSVYGLSGFYDIEAPAQRIAADVSVAGEPSVGVVPWANEAERARANPTRNIRRLTMPVILSVASGIPNVLGDLENRPLEFLTIKATMETSMALYTTEFAARATALGMKNITVKYDALGSHGWDTWRRAAWDQRNMYHFISKI